MPKKGKKKANIADDDPEVEITPRVEIIYEDTKSITWADPEFNWGKNYHMLHDKKKFHMLAWRI